MASLEEKGVSPRTAYWALLVVTLVSACAFVVALFYALWLFMHSLVGFPPRFVIIVVTPLVVSVAAALALAWLKLGVDRAGNRSSCRNPPRST